MKSIVKTALCALIIFSLFCLPSCSDRPVRREDTFLDYFDTVSVITGYETDLSVFRENCKAVEDVLSTYHRLADIYNNYEGINNAKTINDNAGISPVTVDEKLIDLLEYSIEIYYETDGMCNIAMGSVLSIWHSFREEAQTGEPKLPAEDELRAAGEHCDISKIIIDREKSTVYLEDKEMSIDLGAIAKGYATEEAAKVLLLRGGLNYALSIGGNVRTVGTKPEGVPWTTGVINPDIENVGYYAIRVSLTGASLVTSGTYERYYEYEGARYHHIIDPETLYPENDFISVSVLTESSALADALSTALFNMPLEEGKAFVEGLADTDAFWILSDGTFEMTSGFENYVIHS